MARVASIIAAGIAVRLLLLLIVDPFSNPITGDAVVYLNRAHPSLYSFVLAIPWPAVIALQCSATIGSGVGAYLILKNYWAGLLIAACPFLAFYDFELLSESLYVNLIFWAFMLYRQRWWSGCLLGAAILVRSTFFFLPAAVFLFRRSRTSMIFSAMAYIVALPVLGFLDQEHSGLALWIGTWERTPAWYARGLNNPHFPARASVTQQETDDLARNDDSGLRYAAVERIERNPPLVLLNWIVRYPRLWIGTRSDQIKWRIGGTGWVVFKCLFFGMNLALLILGIVGLLRERGLFAIPVAYVAVVYIPFHNTETRYSLAALPFLCVYAAQLLHGLLVPRLRPALEPVRVKDVSRPGRDSMPA